MAKRAKKKTRKQKIAESKNLTCESERTPRKLIDELNAMDCNCSGFFALFGVHRPGCDED